ncbi:hypothetical protein H2203_005992 [Taxawa tesnikishii (nom. ined.)]|nr:hypothetical protein H2203_005992 [Dothideales sp. JES 119]
MFLLETVPKAPGEYPLTLKRFNGIKELSDKNLQYAILSHTWDEDEVKKGYEKVYRTLDQAWRDGYAYVWVDSCCIDKSSSAELSEAINSMYAWYEAAAKCYAYLADVPLESDPHAPDSRFCSSRWFTRGWTLQELLAPTDLVFFSQDWKPLNDKIQLREPVSRATRIDADILAKKRPLESASIAERMSWAAGRETTRTEDKAYCLMGIFSVNMPMLYGEGDKAFLRLQEEIMKQSDDHSLFAWANSKHKPDMLHGLLADSPDDFNFPEAQYIVPYSSWEKESPYGMTNRGLDIELHMRPLDANNARYIAALHCPSPTSQGYFLAVVLQRLGSGADSDTYARIECHKLQTVSERGKRIPVFIPQTIAPQDRDSVYPLHIFQLSGLPVSYCLTQAMRTADFDDDDRRLMPSLDSKRSFKILKKLAKSPLCSSSPTLKRTHSSPSASALRTLLK